MIEQALQGVRVLEFCNNLVCGPYCSKLLGDMGAEIIKIENPEGGDIARGRGPFLNDIPHPDRSGLFLYLNTNKLGITLNPKVSTGKRILTELVKDVDIFIEANPPQMMKDLGLDYESLKEINPKLIMTSITPFGQSGPYKDYKAYHLNIIHGGGGGYLMPGGSPNLDREPLKGGGYFDDYANGLTAAIATIGALYGRDITGSGQYIDASEQEMAIALDRVEVTQYPNEGRSGNRGPQEPLGGMGLMPCRDGYVFILGVMEHQWKGLLDLMGNPEWSKDEKYKDMSSRAKYTNELYSHISEWFKDKSKDEVYHEGQAKGIPIAPIATPEEVVNSEQYKARGFFTDVEHPETGKIKYPSAPYIFSETPWRVNRPAPLLGQHNDEIYCNRLGYTKEELVKMKEARVI